MLTLDEIAEIAKKARAAAEADPLISIQEVAEQYGISLRTLRRRQAAGLMPTRTKHGRWLKYQQAEIAELIARHKDRACSKEGEQS
jgi:predicted DNA-binding transcriptional regulator AlpA